MVSFYERLSLVIQVFLLVAGLGALVVYWFQLRAMRKSLQQTLIMQRRELYTGMTTSLTDDEVSAMMLHVADHFNPEIYRERLCGKRTANTKLSLNEEKVSLPGNFDEF